MLTQGPSTLAVVAQTANWPRYHSFSQILTEHKTTKNKDYTLYLSVMPGLKSGQREVSKYVMCQLSFPSSLLIGIWT